MSSPPSAARSPPPAAIWSARSSRTRHRAHHLPCNHIAQGPAVSEFQRRNGMGTDLYAEVIAPRRTSTWAPCRSSCAVVGTHEDLLLYLRAACWKTGANTSRVNRVVDDMPAQSWSPTRAKRCVLDSIPSAHPAAGPIPTAEPGAIPWASTLPTTTN